MPFLASFDYSWCYLITVPHSLHPFELKRLEMSSFNIDLDSVIQKTGKYLAPQGPLKEFVAQNPLRGFLDLEFHDALRRSAATYGAWSYQPLGFYREAWEKGQISESALRRSLEWNISDPEARERARSDLFEYPEGSSKKPRSLVRTGIRAQWEHFTGLNVIDKSLPVMFRLLGAYLDQGISVWRMPGVELGFFEAVKQLVTSGFIPYRPFNEPLVRDLLNSDVDTMIPRALERLLGNPDYAERYVMDLIMSHPGWSATVSFIAANPNALVLSRKITIKEMIAVELLLDLGFLSRAFGGDFSAMAHYGAKINPIPMDQKNPMARVDFVKSIWHEAWEWGFYEQSLSLMSSLRARSRKDEKPSVQALFCLDDRECSMRRYLEAEDSSIKTYGLPGFFGVDFMYQCADELFPTRHAPIVINPTHLIKASYNHVGKTNPPRLKRRLMILDHATHTMFRGWLITQVMGLMAAARLALAVFRPTMTQATASSLSKVNENVRMKIQRETGDQKSPDGYFHGFTIDEMGEKVGLQLEAIGLIKDFAPIVVLFAHGSSSTNNTHFSAYDCGACSGKPGSPNSRVFAEMANHPEVRRVLTKRGIVIPDEVRFVAALHDTTRDEVKYFDLKSQPEPTRKALRDFSKKMSNALGKNAKERCRRFEMVKKTISDHDALDEVRRRSVSIFEPRPELTHTGNAMAIIGRRHLTGGGFFDRRAFLHSYDATIDADGQILRRILAAVVPVCGGINLCYYFSKLDGDVYGSGTKLPHNIIGLIGVSNGVEGDIQTGLPRQMVEFHDPVRLQLVIEQKPDVVTAVFEKEPNLFVWIRNNWMRLVCIDPASGQIHLWKNGTFVELSTGELPVVEVKQSARECYEGEVQNVPLRILNAVMPEGGSSWRLI